MATVSPSTTTPAAQTSSQDVAGSSLQQAGAALLAVVTGTQGCSDPTLASAALDFQNAWNASGQTAITATGQYDAPTASALGQVVAQGDTSSSSSQAAPAACTTSVPAMTILGAAPINWGPPIIVGALAVSVGLVAWAWYTRPAAQKARRALPSHR